MRLLFVLPALPYPPSDGGKMKVFNVLKYLSPRHECELVCLGEADAALLAQLKGVLPQLGTVRLLPGPTRFARRLGAVFSILCLKPPSFARFASAKLRALLLEAQASGKYDVIHFDIINMAQYHLAGSATASVHSPNDATSQVYFRIAHVVTNWMLKAKLYASALLLRRFERMSYAFFSKIHVVSEDDKRYLKRVAPLADVDVIPISSGYPYVLCERPAASGARHSALTITVCGNLGDASIAQGFAIFLEDVFPYLLTRFPDLRVRVLGRQILPPLLQRLRACPQVEYFAWADSFEDFLSEADVILVPDMAGAPGAKTRVVQAMALGLAVVGSETAFEGIPVQSGVHGLIYASLEECRDMLSALLDDAPQRQRLGAAAAVLAAEEYSLERIGPKYEALYYAAAACHTRNAIGGAASACASQRQNRP